MRKFLLINLMLCCCFVAGAQKLAKLDKLNAVPQQEAISKGTMSLSAINTTAMSVAGKDTRAVEDYILDPKILTNNAPNLKIYIGEVGISGTMEVATYINKYLGSRFAGNTIKKIYTAIGEGASNVTVWIKKNITDESVWETTLTDFKVNEIIPIDCDYVLDGEGFFLGYTITGNFQTGLIFFTENSVGDYTFVVGNGQQWSDISSNGSAFFLCETEGDGGLAKNDILLSSISFVDRAKAGEEYEIVGEFVNFGCYPVMSYKAKVTIDGQEKEFEAKCDTTGYMGACSFSIPNVAPKKSGRYESIFEVTELNGEADGYTPNNIAECELIAMSQSFPRKAVMEELTGTWCGWCPRGAVAIENLKRDFPNDFIAIAIHGPSNSNDPFKASTYMTLADGGFGYPTAILNRIVSVDPYYGFNTNNPYGVKDIIDLITQLPTEAQMGVSSKLSDDESTIEVTSYTKFSLEDDECPYMVGYVLLEDKLMAAQSNYYSSQVAQQYGITEAGLPADLKPLYQKKYQYSNIFDDVARGIYDCFGIEGSLSGAISTNDVKTHTYTIDVPNSIKNFDNVSVVALLFDIVTGEIIAAEKAYLGESVLTGIETVTENEMNASVKAVQGNLLITAQEATVNIYNVEGKLLHSEAVNGTANVSTQNMNGTIIVRVENGKDAFVKKIAL